MNYMWAFITRLDDILQLIGLVMVVWWAIKGSLWISHKWRTRTARG